jgi:hypothetical protein
MKKTGGRKSRETVSVNGPYQPLIFDISKKLKIDGCYCTVNGVFAKQREALFGFLGIKMRVLKI